MEDRKEPNQAKASRATAGALARKARSETRLQAEGVPFNKHLPAIEDEQGARRRSKEQIAWRAMALMVVAVKGEGLEHSAIGEIVDEYGLKNHFTPKEAAFIQNPSPSDHDRTQFVWRYEAAWTLLWALGYIEVLDMPSSICDVPVAVTFMRDQTPAEFIANASLRPMEQLLDAADLIYRYHWAVVNARVHGEDAPESLEPGVTMERHYALNWLIGYMDQEWDDISTDT